MRSPTASCRRATASARWRGRRKPIFFVARSKRDGSPLGIYQVVGPGRVEPVMIFSKKAPTYYVRFNFAHVVGESVSCNSAKAFNEALARAIATAK